MMGLRIRGYEKAWTTFNTGMTVPVTTIALMAVSLTDMIEAPPEALIVAAVIGIVSTIFQTGNAFIAANSKPEERAELEALAGEVLSKSETVNRYLASRATPPIPTSETQPDTLHLRPELRSKEEPKP